MQTGLPQVYKFVYLGITITADDKCIAGSSGGNWGEWGGVGVNSFL